MIILIIIASVVIFSRPKAFDELRHCDMRRLDVLHRRNEQQLAIPSGPAIYDRADRRVHSLFLEATSFPSPISHLISVTPSFNRQK
ncbi:hypothetical protein A1D17_19210 [Pseudomonas fluorescens]|uniref:Uncharacterized protein n=1 Tax=Pseudomonas fluorescens TaxID=294 RepID=A0A166P0P7_PSEFL|nr:hypothetical protein A1D17_19210 [Pseudomonas fluorescens]